MTARGAEIARARVELPQPGGDRAAWEQQMVARLRDLQDQLQNALEQASGVAVVTKAGAFVADDIPQGSARIGKDTVGGTRRLYFNDGGVLVSVGLV